MHRAPFLTLACLAVAGCQPFYAAAGVVTGVNAAALVTTGRAVPDLIYSAISGRDCSSTRLERGASYCVPPDPPVTVVFCTRSLGTPDCWSHPERLANDPRAIADAPGLTEAQVEHGKHRWPNW